MGARASSCAPHALPPARRRWRERGVVFACRKQGARRCAGCPLHCKLGDRAARDPACEWEGGHTTMGVGEGERGARGSVRAPPPPRQLLSAMHSLRFIQRSRAARPPSRRGACHRVAPARCAGHASARLRVSQGPPLLPRHASLPFSQRSPGLLAAVMKYSATVSSSRRKQRKAHFSVRAAAHAALRAPTLRAARLL